MKIFDMMTNEDIKRVVKKPVDLEERVKELNNSLSIALEINDNYQRENVALKKEIEKLKADLARVTLLNLIHQQDIKR